MRDAIRFYVGFHQRADGIDGAYLHDPVTLIASLLRPDVVTETVEEQLACDTSADLYAAGSLYRDESGDREAVRETQYRIHKCFRGCVAYFAGIRECGGDRSGARTGSGVCGASRWNRC